MKKLLIVALALLIVGVLAAERFHEKGMEHHQEMGKRQRDNHPRIMRIMSQLELTESQISELEAKKIKWEKAAINHRAEIEIKELDAKMAHKDMDFDQLKKLTSEIFELKKEHKLKGIDHMEECWNMLNNEQKEQAKELLKQPRKHRNLEEDGESEFKGQRNRRNMNN